MTRILRDASAPIGAFFFKRKPREKRGKSGFD